MADPRKFIYDSDYSIPAFVAKWTGSFNISANGYITPSFNHNLPFIPLIVGQWSLNPNFEPAYDISTQNGYYIGVNINQIAGSDVSNIKFNITNGYNNSITYYYRLFAFAPNDYNGDIPAIEDETNFRFNSDFNYLKLFAYGEETIPSSNMIEVYHNLGYVPQVKTWYYDSLEDIIAPFPNIYYEDNSYNLGTIVDTAKMTFKGIMGDKVYYHIYIDEA